MTTPFLVDPPRPGIDRVSGVLLLDADGVLNILDENVDREKLPTVDGSSGRPLSVNPIDDDILDILNDALRPGVWLCWLTTWGFRVSRLQGLLNARLRGGFVVIEKPALRFAPPTWKHDAALRLARQYPNAAIAWADDYRRRVVQPTPVRGAGSVRATRPGMRSAPFPGASQFPD